MKEALTRKIGPLPTWAWIAIVGAAVVLWAFWKNKQSAAATSQSATVPDTTPPVIDQFQLTSPPLQEDETDSGTNTGSDTGNGTGTTTGSGSPSGTSSGPPPVSRVNRSPAVRHKIHQINQIHNKKTAVEHHSRKASRPGPVHVPTGKPGGNRHVPAVRA